MFNVLEVIRAPAITSCLESEEAEVWTLTFFKRILKIVGLLVYWNTKLLLSTDWRVHSFQMDLLHLMIFGKSSNVSLTRWYLILEKAIEALDKGTTHKQQILRTEYNFAQQMITDFQIKILKIMFFFWWNHFQNRRWKAKETNWMSKFYEIIWHQHKWSDYMYLRDCSNPIQGHTIPKCYL